MAWPHADRHGPPQTALDRTAYAVVAWRSQPHLPEASAATAVVQAVHREYGATTHVLTAHVRALLQVIANHIVLARRLADVVRFMHGAIRSGRIEGCLSRGEGCSDRPDTV